MPATHITDHQARALAQLMTQYRTSVSVGKLTTAATAEHQVVEDQLWSMLVETVDSAEGGQLDVLGATVGQPRSNRPDAIYRIWIMARIAMNAGSGTPEDILRVFSSIIGDTASLMLTEQYPAQIALTVGPTASLEPRLGAAILREVKPGGVQTYFISATSDDASSFAFAPSGAGFGTTANPAVGGMLASSF